jgi:hypothetical protein
MPSWRIAESRFSNQFKDLLTTAEQLLRRDESEMGAEFGKNVADMYPIAVLVINTSDHAATIDLARRGRKRFNHGARNGFRAVIEY